MSITFVPHGSSSLLEYPKGYKGIVEGECDGLYRQMNGTVLDVWPRPGYTLLKVKTKFGNKIFTIREKD